MSKSLIRKNQLHPDITDLVGQYGSGYFVSSTSNQTIAGLKTFSNGIISNAGITGNASIIAPNLVYNTGNQTIAGLKTFSNGIISNAGITGNASIIAPNLVYNTGNQTISGVKTFRNLKIGPTESVLGQSIDITYYNNNFRLISNNTNNGSIIDSAIVRGAGDPGGNDSFWAYRFNADPNNERAILQLNNPDAYEVNGNYPNSFQFFDISVLGTGNEYFYLDSKSGVMRLTRRPTVNGTGVLLSGEATQLPNTIVYTTGNQTISGIKNFDNIQIINSPYNYFTNNITLSNNYINLANSPSNITGTLPQVISGRNYIIKNLNTGVLTITGANLIDGNSNLNLYRNESVHLIGVNNIGFTGWAIYNTTSSTLNSTTNNTRWRITIDDDGILTTTKL